MSQERNQRKRKLIDRDTEVVIANNTYGMFVWESRNGDTSIVLDEHGDEEFITYGELRKLKKYLTNMDIVITAVNSEEGDVSIMDIARGLRIRKTYEDYFKIIENLDEDEAEDVENIDADAIEDFILDSDVDDYKEAFDSSLKETIIETSVELYKRHELGDHGKIRLIQKSRPEDERGDFWSDIDASSEDQSLKKERGHPYER